MNSPATSGKEEAQAPDAEAGATAASLRRPLLHPAIRFIVVLSAFTVVVAGISTPPSNVELRLHWKPSPGLFWVFGMPLLFWLVGGFWVICGTASWRSPVKRGSQYAVMVGLMLLLGLLILAGTTLWLLFMALGPVR